MRRRDRGLRIDGEPALAFAYGITAIAIAAMLFPSSPIAWAAAAVIGALPAWWRHARALHVAELRFAPDPKRPDFASFADAFAASIADVASGAAAGRTWTLCPYCGEDGSFRTYSIEPVPANGSVEIGSVGRKVAVRPQVALRMETPVPVTVADRPVTVSLAASTRRGEIRLCAPGRRWRTRWLAPLHPIRHATMLTLMAVPPLLMAAFPDCEAFSSERVAATMAVMAVVMVRLSARKAS